MTQKAVVVFLGSELVEGASWWSRLLKPGFIHCFVLLQDMHWVKIEGRHGAVRVTQLGEHQSGNVVSHYRAQGAIVVETIVYAKSVRAPFVARTCVGLVKAMLGIKSFSLTPWQLYKHLTRG